MERNQFINTFSYKNSSNKRLPRIFFVFDNNAAVLFACTAISRLTTYLLRKIRRNVQVHIIIFQKGK